LPGFALTQAANSLQVFEPLAGPTAMANWKVAPCAISVKSLTGS